MHRAADSPQEEKAQDADLPELVILSNDLIMALVLFGRRFDE